MMLDDEALAENYRFSMAADCQRVFAAPASSEYVDSFAFVFMCVYVCVLACNHARKC